MPEISPPFLMPVTPSFRLDGKRAFIAGAGRGLGAAAASALAQAGAEVTLVARTVSQVEAVAQGLRNAGYVAHSMAMDVTIAARVAEHIANLGPFDILVNCAGTNRPALLCDTQDEDLQAVFNLNVNAAFYLSRAVAKGLLAAKRPGSIIHMSSQMGHVGGLKRSVYCASKHALEGMTKALAWELGEQKIRVNTICPTFIETEMTQTMLKDPAFSEYVCSRIALGRLGRVHDIMGAVVFLASDAAAMITGSALMVDGGWTAQ